MTLPWSTIDWMSAWNDFEEQATADERREITDMFSVRKTVGTPTSTEILACSLFCRPPDVGPVWDPPTRQNVHQIRARAGRMSWWEAYAAPLFRNLHRLPFTYPNREVHLYLAADLDWLVPDLTLPGVVIHVMNHSSIAAVPGMMWRYLAHDLPGVTEIYNVDIEDSWTSLRIFEPHVEAWRKSQLALFRHYNPHEWSPDVKDLLVYRPLVGCHLFYRPQPDFSAFKSCCASVWLAMKNRFPTTMNHPWRGDVPMFGHRWPDYGFDESYLQHILYPHFLPRGIYSHWHTSRSEVLFPLDLFATAKANPGSIAVMGK